jgi:hypothetical protein
MSVVSVDELAARGLILPQTAQIFRNERGEPRPLYQRQVEALELARRGESYVVTSGTGSGKSLSSRKRLSLVPGSRILHVLDPCLVSSFIMASNSS